MANAPTRPPNRPRSDRRPPKGPFVATLRERLTVAARELKQAGHKDSAAAVDAVLAPGGWTLLREQDAPFTTNLPLTMRSSLKVALKKAAENRGVTLTAVVTEGHRKVMDGTWIPPKPTRAGAAAPGDGRAVLNVTVEDALRTRLRDSLPSLSDDLGYNLTEGGIAVAYLKKYFATELADLRHRLGLSESGVLVIEHTEGTWTAQQCAAFRGVSRKQWLADVASGVEPSILGVTKDGFELWDVAAVRGY